MNKTTKNSYRNCGFEYPHPGGSENCPAAKSTCRYCQNKGHFERVCRKKKADNNNGGQGQNRNTGTPTPSSGLRERNNKPRRAANSTTFNVSESQTSTEDYNPGLASTISDSSDDESQGYVYQAYSEKASKLPKFEIVIAGSPVTVTADTESTCDIIDEKTYKKINENYIKTKGMEVKLSNTTQEILTYNANEPLPLLGTFKAHAKSKDRVIVSTFYVTKGSPGNLLSFNSCLDLDLIQVNNNIHHLPTSGSTNTDTIINKYPEIFEERIGKLKDYEVKLHIDSEVKPIAQPHRRIPFHLRAKVEKRNRAALVRGRRD